MQALRLALKFSLTTLPLTVLLLRAEPLPAGCPTTLAFDTFLITEPSPSFPARYSRFPLVQMLE